MSTTVKLTLETGDRSPDAVERELRETLEETTDESPRISQYAGNVVWSGSGVPEVERIQEVDVPRVVQTRYNDTVDAGSGELWERVGGEFVAVDSIESPAMDLGEYVLDYFRINYGIAPWYRYSKPDDPGTLDRPPECDDWQSLLSPAAFETPDFADETAAAAALGASDQPDRERAVRYLAFEGTEDPERYEQFLETLSDVDERTRALVGSELWIPAPVAQDATTTASLVRSLLSLTDDAVPEVRIGAFMGASRAIEAFYQRVEDSDASEDTLNELLESFYTAHARLLDDTDTRIRERTARCLGETLGSEGVHIFYDGIWLRVGFRTRWNLARAVEENAHDDTLGTLDFASEVTTTAFNGERSAVSTLVEYVYHERGPSHRAVRAMLADFASDEPAVALDALDPAIDAVASGEELVADLKLLAALATERPARVATVAEEIARVLEEPGEEPDAGDDERSRSRHDYPDQEDPEEKRRAAARVLDELPTDAHPVDQELLAAATGGITREEYGKEKLVPERVSTLSRVSPDAAVDAVRDFPGRINYDINENQGLFHTRVDTALHEVSKVDSGVIAAALPDLIPLVEDAPRVSGERAVAIARTATEHPDRVAAYCAAVGTLVGHYDPLVREAAATTLVAVGRARPDALSEPYTALLDRSEAALGIERLETILDRDDISPETPADWPAGALSSDVGELTDIVVACLDEDFFEHELLAGLVREIHAGDPDTAEQLLAALIDDERSVVLLDSRPGVMTRLDETDPALLAGVGEQIVGVLADPDFETTRPDRDSTRPSPGARSLEAGLLSAAKSDPEAALAAIEAEYQSVVEFVTDHETGHRRKIANLVDDSESTPRVTESATTPQSDDEPGDPFFSFRPGWYAADIVVDTDDISATASNEELQLVRCRVTEDDNLREIDDNSFVRRIVGPDGPIGTIPGDANADEEPVSALLQLNVPEPFVLLSNPDDENALTKLMRLDVDVDKFQLFAYLCQSVAGAYSRREIKTIEERLDQLDDIEDADGPEELVRRHLL